MLLFSLCTSDTAAVVTKENSLSIVCLSKLLVIYLILCYELRWWFNFIKFRDYDKLSDLRNVRKEIGIKVENIKINIVAKKRINKRIKIERISSPQRTLHESQFFRQQFSSKLITSPLQIFYVRSENVCPGNIIDFKATLLLSSDDWPN